MSSYNDAQDIKNLLADKTVQQIKTGLKVEYVPQKFWHPVASVTRLKKQMRNTFWK